MLARERPAIALPGDKSVRGAGTRTLILALAHPRSGTVHFISATLGPP